MLELFCLSRDQRGKETGGVRWPGRSGACSERWSRRRRTKSRTTSPRRRWTRAAAGSSSPSSQASQVSVVHWIRKGFEGATRCSPPALCPNSGTPDWHSSSSRSWRNPEPATSENTGDQPWSPYFYLHRANIKRTAKVDKQKLPRLSFATANNPAEAKD